MTIGPTVISTWSFGARAGHDNYASWKEQLDQITDRDVDLELGHPLIAPAVWKYIAAESGIVYQRWALITAALAEAGIRHMLPRGLYQAQPPGALSFFISRHSAPQNISEKRLKRFKCWLDLARVIKPMRLAQLESAEQPDLKRD